MPEQPNIPISEGLVRTYDLLEHLVDDVGKAFETLESDKTSPYLRRCLARTVFAFIEGVIQIAKWEINASVRRDETSIELSEKDREILLEQKKINGEVIKILIPVDENLRKTFRLAAKVWGLKNYSMTEGKEYKEFRAAKKARNRLTHPRTYYDITVTDADMHCYASSFLWVQEEFISLMNNRVESLVQELPAELRQRCFGRYNCPTYE